MRPIRGIFGLALMIFSLLGLAASIAGLVFVPRLGTGVADQIQHGMDLGLRTLGATGDSLALAGTSLDQGVTALGSVHDATVGVGDTLGGTDPLLDSVATVIGTDIPAVISSTQSSLAEAASSAAVVDEMLYSLSAISVMIGQSYAPPEPLEDSITKVAESLNGLPVSFGAIEGDLRSLKGSLGSVQGGVDGLADSLVGVQGTLGEAQGILDEYTAVVGDLEDDLQAMHDDVPTWVRYVRYGAYFVLVWLLVTQVGLLFQGWEMFTWHRRQRPAEKPTTPLPES